MKAISFLLTLMMLTACGNPHLTDSSKGLSFSPAVTGDPFSDPSVTNPDGGGYLSVTTNENTINGQLTVLNKNPDELLTEYSIQKGEHFRFKSGSCSGNLEAGKNCVLDIEFFATEPGEYNDNLVIVSSMKSKPELKKTRLVPLKGKRLSGDSQPPTIQPSNGGTVIEISITGSNGNIQVTQTNPNPDEMIITYRFAKGEHFRFNGGTFPGTNGNCTESQQGQSGCEIDIEFFSDVPGRFQDELIVTFAPKSNPAKEKTIRIPLIGERLAPPAPPATDVTATSIGGSSEIDFGSAVIDSPVRKDKIIVENKGATDSTIKVELVGGAPFAIIHNCPASLAPGAKCEIETSYASTSVGKHKDTVKISAGTSTGPLKVIKVPLKGETLEKPLSPGQIVFEGVQGESLNFGTIAVGAESRKLVTVKNIGEAPVQLDNEIISGEGFTMSGGTYPGAKGTCGKIILPGSCTIELSFLPAKKGHFNGVLSLVRNGSTPLNLALVGDGKEEATGCFRVEERLISARPGANSAGIAFPYLTATAGTTAKLSILYGTATNSRIPDLNRYTVKNGQVYVSFDVPALGNKEELMGAELVLDVTKVIQDGYKDTESLCLTTNKIRTCSGRGFTLASWQKLRNPKFWDQHPTPVTTLYEEEFEKTSASCGNYTCFTMVRSLSIRALFSMEKPEVQSLMGGAVNFVFSDDTRLRNMPQMKLSVKKPVACH
ncbi:MAG: choice-of-anchor D domain-containing protein [Bdellovibrionota bacterium]